jgi:hypothetical protein
VEAALLYTEAARLITIPPEEIAATNHLGGHAAKLDR